LTADNATVSDDTASPVADYTYSYDIAGNVSNVEAQLGSVTTTGEPGDSTVPINLASTFDYNGDRLTLSANIGGTAEFDDGEFDDFSGGTNDFKNTYSYDALSDMTGITQTGNGGNTVTAKNVVLSYDADQRLVGANMYQSDSTSDLVSSAAYTYDGDSRLTDLMYTTETGGGGTVLAGYHWGYNSDGNVTDFYSHNDSSAGTPNTTYVSGSSNWGHAQYSYDATQQLTGTTYSDFTDAPDTGTSETYDANGNRTSDSSVISTNRVLFDGTYYYTYDAAGNRTSQYQIADDEETNVTTYDWNNKNQLVSVTAGDTTVTYSYDAYGNMVARTQSDTTESYVYDGKNLALVLSDTSGTVSVAQRELYGPAVVQVLASENGSTHVVSWYLTDNQGTVRDVVQYSDDTTSSVDHVIYDAFGNAAQGAGFTSDPLPTFTYDGTWQDPQTNLNPMGARWYDAVDAVFASYFGGPGYQSGAVNPYEYSNDDPTATDLAMQSQAVNSPSAVGITDGGGTGRRRPRAPAVRRRARLVSDNS
jgi:RHS repeat-associated protein